MTISQDLIAIEKKFWTSGEAFYRQNVDDTCLIAFTEMAGVFDKAEIAATAKDDKRWRDVEIKQKGLIEPTPNVAILSYEAHATRHDGQPYEALVSTGYVKRDGAWKMAFHQQTPLSATK